MLCNSDTVFETDRAMLQHWRTARFHREQRRRGVPVPQAMVAAAHGAHCPVCALPYITDARGVVTRGHTNRHIEPGRVANPATLRHNRRLLEDAERRALARPQASPNTDDQPHLNAVRRTSNQQMHSSRISSLFAGLLPYFC